MHDSVLRIEQVVTELGNRDVPIRFAELFAAEKNTILRMVTEDVAMVSVISLTHSSAIFSTPLLIRVRYLSFPG